MRYFLPRQTGQQVVNDSLKMQPGGKKRGGNQTAANQKAAETNRATPSRPFAVISPKPAAVSSPAKVVKHDKWAGGAFLNSPAPSALPMPSIGMPLTMQPVHLTFLDPAIVTSSSQQMPASNAPPSVPQVLLSPGSRVHAQFLDGEWYDGTIHGNTDGGHLIFFDGFEDEGVYEIAFAVIRPHLPPNNPPQHGQLNEQLPFPIPSGAGIVTMSHPAHAPPPPPTSLADLEKQLLSYSPPARGKGLDSNIKEWFVLTAW